MGQQNKLRDALVMGKGDFWGIIAQAKETCGQNEDEYVQWVKEELIELGPHYAQDFHDILHAYSELADKYGLWSAAGMMGYASDDKFTDFRSWLIAQGREVYFAALKNPDSLADTDPGDGTWFESFTSVGDAAMREINGGSAYTGSSRTAHNDLVSELKADIEYDEGINYPFEGDELADYFPRLSERYPGKSCHWNHSNDAVQAAREAGPPPKLVRENNMEMGGM